MRILPSIVLVSSMLAVSCGQADFFGHNDKEHGSDEQPPQAEAPDESVPGSTEDPGTKPADPAPVVTIDDDEDPATPPCVAVQTEVPAAQAQAPMQSPAQNPCQPRPTQEP